MLPQTKVVGLQIYVIVSKEWSVLEREKEMAHAYFSKKCTRVKSGKEEKSTPPPEISFKGGDVSLSLRIGAQTGSGLGLQEGICCMENHRAPGLPVF